MLWAGLLKPLGYQAAREVFVCGYADVFLYQQSAYHVLHRLLVYREDVLS